MKISLLLLFQIIVCGDHNTHTQDQNVINNHVNSQDKAETVTKTKLLNVKQVDEFIHLLDVTVDLIYSYDNDDGNKVQFMDTWNPNDSTPANTQYSTQLEGTYKQAHVNNTQNVDTQANNYKHNYNASKNNNKEDVKDLHHKEYVSMKIDRSNPNVKNILDVKFSDNALNNKFNVKMLAHINGIFCIKLNNKTIKTFPIGINEDGSLYEIGTNKLVHIKNKPVYVRTLKNNKYSEKIYHSMKKYLRKKKQKEIKPKQ